MDLGQKFQEEKIMAKASEIMDNIDFHKMPIDDPFYKLKFKCCGEVHSLVWDAMDMQFIRVDYVYSYYPMEVNEKGKLISAGILKKRAFVELV